MASKRNKHEEHAAKARLQMFEAKQELEVIKQVRRHRDNRFAVLASITTLVAVVALQSVYFSAGPGHESAKSSSTPAATKVKDSTKVPSYKIAQGKSWDATMTINSVDLSMTLDGAKAPKATSNFLVLAQKSFFNNTTCHRLTTSGVFILQCGDPSANGTGGPGYSFGPVENAPKAIASGDHPNQGFYPAGTIAMARQSNNGSSMGSQFFIVYKDSYFPNDSAGGYSIFGKITSGLSKLDPFIKEGVVDGAGDGKPKAEFKINKVLLKSKPQDISGSATPTPNPSSGGK